MLDWIVALICLPGSWLLSRWMVGYAHRKRLVDVPGARSSHQQPTATGGGVAIVLCWILYLSYAAFTQLLPWEQLIALLVGGSMIAVIGFADDHFGMGVVPRLIVQIVAVAFVLSLLSPLPALQIAGWFWGDSWSLSLFYLFTLVWLLNLFNFMDGIDGLAVAEAISVLLGAILIMGTSGVTADTKLLLALFCSVAGFGCLNWAPAKMFMGDVGSGFLGFTLGALALVTVQSGWITLWSWIILLAVFISDASVTLTVRLISGQKVYQAHNSHAYQVVARRWQSHSRTSLAVLLINLIWLWPLALMATQAPQAGVFLALLAHLPLTALAITLGAGRN